MGLVKEITWDEVRKGDWLFISQDVPAEGPRVFYKIRWAGEVVEHSPKWTFLKLNGKQFSVPARWGNETIQRGPKKEIQALIKELEQ